MTSKIMPKEAYEKCVMYHGFELSDDDDMNENHITINKRPSDVTINDDANYDTSSDSSGYNDNDYTNMTKRRPSFVRNSINKFSQKIMESNGTTKQTLGATIIKNKKGSCCSLKRILCFWS